EQKQMIETVFALSRGSFAGFTRDSERGYERRLGDAIERYNKLYTEIHSRLALACSCFFFALVGRPYAIQQGRRQFLTSFALCFVPILVVYYPIVLVTMTLGKDN